MGWYRYGHYGFKPYVSVAQRHRNAQKHVAKLVKDGRTISPVTIDGRTIAKTFWGKAWCDNLESYSDFENRLPRGRSYVRNGSVLDLQIDPGRVTAVVSGSEIYSIEIKIKPLATSRWNAIKSQCAGKVASVIELLQGRLSSGVMEIITCHDGGMFPAPSEISLDCSCPDWATMCKHVAAALYGVGARLDHQPELFFKLRNVDHLDLIEQVGSVQAMTRRGAGGKKTIAAGELADVFGIELEGPTRKQRPAPPEDAQPHAKPKPAKPAKVRKPAAGSLERPASPRKKAALTRGRSRKATAKKEATAPVSG